MGVRKWQFLITFSTESNHKGGWVRKRNTSIQPLHTTRIHNVDRLENRICGELTMINETRENNSDEVITTDCISINAKYH